MDAQSTPEMLAAGSDRLTNAVRAYAATGDQRYLAEFKTDILDQGDHYELRADLPGFKKEDISLSLDGDTLVISAERHSDWEDKDKQGNFVRCERSYGNYSRSYDMSEIQTDAIEAGYQDGVLTLKLPKKAPNTPASRQIEIK